MGQEANVHTDVDKKTEYVTIEKVGVEMREKLENLSLQLLRRQQHINQNLQDLLDNLIMLKMSRLLAQ